MENLIETAQKDYCRVHGANYVATPRESKLGFALSTDGMVPLNGLRHPVARDTSGWYLWCGEEFFERADFFDSVHAAHVYERRPEIAKFLGLPPGYRFLISNDYVDVWYDPSLLNL